MNIQVGIVGGGAPLPGGGKFRVTFSVSHEYSHTYAVLTLLYSMVIVFLDFVCPWKAFSFSNFLLLKE